MAREAELRAVVASQAAERRRDTGRHGETRRRAEEKRAIYVQIVRLVALKGVKARRSETAAWEGDGVRSEQERGQVESGKRGERPVAGDVRARA